MGQLYQVPVFLYARFHRPKIIWWIWNVDSLDEDIDSINEAFDKLEEKVSRLSRRWGDKDTNNEDTSNEESKVFSKKPKLFEKLDSNNKTDNPGSDEESDSHSTEEEFAKKLDRDADSNITY